MMNPNRTPTPGDCRAVIGTRIYETDDGKEFVAAIDFSANEFSKDDITVKRQGGEVVVYAGRDGLGRPQFAQSFSPPSSTALTETIATYNNGVLVITIPFTSERDLDVL